MRMVLVLAKAGIGRLIRYKTGNEVAVVNIRVAGLWLLLGRSKIDSRL